MNSSLAILIYKNIQFYPISQEHLNDIKNWRNTQMDVLRQIKPLTDCNQKNWFQTLNNDPSQVIFSIGIKKRDNNITIIGYCGLTNIDFINKRAEISFILNTLISNNNSKYRNIFLKTLTLLCLYAFDTLNLNKLFIESFSFRTEHIKVIEEFGLKRDGVLRKHQFKKGQYFDSIIHSILISEWRINKQGGKTI